MKKVYLHGKLGKRFGEEWVFNVKTPHEVFRALDSNIENFSEYIIEAQTRGIHYMALKKDVLKIKSEEDLVDNLISEDNLDFIDKSEEIHICNAPTGEMPPAVAAVVTFFKAVAATKLTVGSIIAKIVFAVAMQAIMNAITKPPEPPKRKDPVSTKSFLMSGGRTRQQQGIAVPLGYGRLKIGATNIDEDEKSFRKTSKKDNLLESYAERVYVDLIGEGPIEGFVNKHGAKLDDSDITEGIYLNDVQVRNTAINPGEKGTLNYILNENMDNESGNPAFTRGEENQNQGIVSGISAIKRYEILLVGAAPYGQSGNSSSVAQRTVADARSQGAKVISHNISNPFVNLVTLCFKGECSDSSDEGEVGKLGDGYRLRFAILVDIGGREYNVMNASAHGIESVEYNSGSGIVKGGEGDEQYFEVNGIATSAYQFDIRIRFDPYKNLESGHESYTFKMLKLSPEFDPTVKDKKDNAESKRVGGITRQRNVQISHVVEHIEDNMNYTNCSLVKMVVDSKNISRMPQRSYHVKMKKLLVPSNYNASTRTYDGPWDGLMKGQDSELTSVHGISDNDKQWSDNPAWVFFDLLHNARYGVGKYGLSEYDIDKWQLYKIAKYCDELVETDYPIETKSLFPRRFISPNIVNPQTSPDSITVYIDPREFTGREYTDLASGLTTKILDEANQLSTEETKERFILEFGSGSGFAGKEVAFFIHAKSEVLSDDEAQYNAASREGKNTIERRTLISSNPDSLSITISGPELSHEIIRVLSGTIYTDQTQSSLAIYGQNTKFVSEVIVGLKIVINDQEYIVEEIVNNNELRINKDISEHIDSSANARAYVKKVIGACATQINHEIVEPRFTANLYLTERREALNVLKSIASIFRGMIAYSSGKIFMIQDSLKNPVMLFNNSNISKEGFSYSGVNKTKRITASLIRFNNKNRDFQPDIVYEEDARAIQKFGYIEKEVLGMGISSEAQARRLAKWILMTSQLETETVTFKTGQNAAYLYPGCIFEISDESRVGKNKSGRILGKSTKNYFSLHNESYANEICSVLIDKFMIDESYMKNVEINIACGNSFSSLTDLSQQAKFETNEEDQDERVAGIFGEQFYRFLGQLTFNDDGGRGRQNQNANITSLKLSQEFEIDLKENIFKRFEHGLKEGDVIKFHSGGVLPAPLNDESKFYVINATENTFQVSFFSSTNTLFPPVYLSDFGKDHWLNDGGTHYFYLVSPPGKSDPFTKNAVERIPVGSIYTLKGSFVQGSQYEGSFNAISDALGISNYNGEGGWYVSDLFGNVWVQGENNFTGWIFSIEYNGWIYVGTMVEGRSNNPDSSNYNWAWNENLGWMWFLEIVNPHYGGKSYWIWMQKVAKWIFFMGHARFWMADQDFEHNEVDNEYVDIFDTGKEALVISTMSEGFWFIFCSYEQYEKSGDFNREYLPYTVSSAQPPDRSLGTSLKNVSLITSQHSSQGQDSIRIEFNTGHGFDLIRNPAIEIRGAKFTDQSSFHEINKEWRVIYVQENIVELVNSYDASQLLLDSEVIEAEAYWDSSPQVESERYYERQTFRVLSVKEVSDNEFEIAGLEYNSSKFLAVDRKGVVRRPHLPIPPQADMEKPIAPTNLVLESLN